MFFLQISPQCMLCPLKQCWQAMRTGCMGFTGSLLSIKVPWLKPGRKCLLWRPFLGMHLHKFASWSLLQSISYVSRKHNQTIYFRFREKTFQSLTQFPQLVEVNELAWTQEACFSPFVFQSWLTKASERLWHFKRKKKNRSVKSYWLN